MTPPTAAQIDEWCEKTETLRQLASSAFVPGQGIDLKAFVVAHALNDGTPMFWPLSSDAFDPTQNPEIARQLDTLRRAQGGVTIRYYHVKQPLGLISPSEAVGSEMDQSRVNDPRNWAIGRGNTGI